MVATPGRLVDMFARKQAAFDLSASVKAMVCFDVLHRVILLQYCRCYLSTLTRICGTSRAFILSLKCSVTDHLLGNFGKLVKLAKPGKSGIGNMSGKQQKIYTEFGKSENVRGQFFQGNQHI